jgi:putative DNA methylase
LIYRKKLIEVALPLDAINDASAYDKMPGIGPHPKGIHQWWARLPLPCSRAVIFASLVDDPSSDPAFRDRPESDQERERDRLFKIIRGLLQKKVHLHPEVFAAAYAEIARSCGGKVPPVFDPFCGGGSIPLEAQRLGLKAYGGDLNPVAVLITKALIEIPARFAGRAPVNPESRREIRDTWPGSTGLAADVRYYGNWIREEAIKRIGHLYPKIKLPKEYGGDEATVLTWLWARTVKCPNPACEATAPLVRSFSLSTKKGRKTWLEALKDGLSKKAKFVVKTGEGNPPEGTVNRGGARCIFCNNPIPFNYIRSEGRAGRITPQLLVMVAEGRRNRVYVSPTPEQEASGTQVQHPIFPDTPIPEQALSFRVKLYGMNKHRDLFTARQLLALTTFSDLIIEAREKIIADAAAAGLSKDGQGFAAGGTGAAAYADAVSTFLAFAVDRCADFNCTLSRWKPSGEQHVQLFARQAIPMVWDFAEANLLCEKGVCWKNAIEITASAIEVIIASKQTVGEASQGDAALGTKSGMDLLVSTDPPYYDNIGYADLSDFFYVWLRRTLKDVYPDLFTTVLVPKALELVATPYRFEGDKQKAKEHFETGFRQSFAALKNRLDPRFPMTVYYAFKQEEEEAEAKSRTGNINLTTGWETMLEALLSAGFLITATWPVRASQAWRMVSMGTNALASYIVLACRPRSENAPLATRREFVSALKKELPEALRQLQHGNIAPVDLAQATIGPGMAVYSRYSKVMEADGSPMPVRTALQIINQELDAYLAEQEGDLDTDTRFCLTWFEQHSMTEGPFGEADVLARARNTSVEGLVDAGVLYSRAGKVRLLNRSELPANWDPLKDQRLTVWECAQQLIRGLHIGGETEAGRLAARMGGGRSEEARALAYRLYAICERKKWAEEAFAYNTLVVSWPAIQEKAAGEKVYIQKELGLE